MHSSFYKKKGSAHMLDFVTDKELLQKDDVSIFDLIERPNKSITDFNNKELGKDGERIAALFLHRKGYHIVDMNWRCKYGEVDIVAKHPSEASAICLVEVKTRLNLNDKDPIVPELNVTKAKQQKYKRLALLYMAMHPEYTAVRFDVISIAETGEKKARLRHLINAFAIDEE